MQLFYLTCQMLSEASRFVDYKIEYTHNLSNHIQNFFLSTELQGIKNAVLNQNGIFPNLNFYLLNNSYSSGDPQVHIRFRSPKASSTLATVNQNLFSLIQSNGNAAFSLPYECDHSSQTIL